jgi:hypothetical protein
MDEYGFAKQINAPCQKKKENIPKKKKGKDSINTEFYNLLYS